MLSPVVLARLGVLELSCHQSLGSLEGEGPNLHLSWHPDGDSFLLPMLKPPWALIHTRRQASCHAGQKMAGFVEPAAVYTSEYLSMQQTPLRGQRTHSLWPPLSGRRATSPDGLQRTSGL